MINKKDLRYIYMWSISYDGFRRKLMEALEAQYDVELALVYPRGLDIYNEELLENNHIIYENGAIPVLLDAMEYDNIGAIPRSVLEGMLPHKSMIMSLMMRESNYDIYEYSFLENVYYKMLYYCFNKLHNNKINLVIFGYIPHHAADCMFYYLAHCLDVKTVLFVDTFFPGRFFLADSLESFGKDISTEFHKILGEQIVLGTEMQRIYDEILFPTESILKKPLKEEFVHYIRAKNILGSMGKLQLMRLLVWDSTRDNRKSHYKRTVKQRWRALLKETKMAHRMYYKRLCDDVDLNEKYIYFGLQMTPEMTTMPLAGEFKNQLLSIRILAEAAKRNNVKVYVKEHWIQYHRDKEFYQDLKSIDNVSIVPLEISSHDLIKNSIAVSTQTGSCVVEGMVHGKCSLVFGRGCPYIGGCGVFLIDSVEQCADIIYNIVEKNIKILEMETLAYFKAIENEAFKFYDCDDLCNSQDYNLDESVMKMMDKVNQIMME